MRRAFRAGGGRHAPAYGDASGGKVRPVLVAAESQSQPTQPDVAGGRQQNEDQDAGAREQLDLAPVQGSSISLSQLVMHTCLISQCYWVYVNFSVSFKLQRLAIELSVPYRWDLSSL